MKVDYVTEPLPIQTPKNGDVFDVIIIGAGPSGMSAALCLRRADLSVLLLDKALPGGQTSTAYYIENYLGFTEPILGEKLSANMEAQLAQNGVFYSCEMVTDILNASSSKKEIVTELGKRYFSKALIIASGLEPKELGLSFEKQFLGRGVSYYAQGDGLSYKDKSVAVIGGGNCACYASDYLLNFVERLYLIHRGSDVKAVKTLKDRVLGHEKTTLLWETEVTEAFGVDKLEKIRCKHFISDQQTWLDVQCVFIYAGRVPSDEMFLLNMKRDEKGFIVTDEYMRTSLSGVYAIGDIRQKQIRQIATAVSDGMIAAINIERDFFR